MNIKINQFEPQLSDSHRSLLLSSPASCGSSFYGGESMKQSWVERSQGSYVVKTGDRTPFGFVNVKKMDRFSTLPEANKKAEVANYIWGKIAKVSATMILAIFLYGSAFAMEASWYSRADLIRDGQDKKTHFIMANGKEFHDKDMVCASWDYPLGSYLSIRNNSNGKSVVVKVSDRTARRFKGKRVDLSKGVFSKIADTKQGIVPVQVEVVNE